MAFETSYQNFIYKRTYSRWVDELMRRENWDESVDRYHKFLHNRIPKGQAQIDFSDACESILNSEVMPSMRALWTAGPALERDNIAGYNCAYVAINHPKKFAELLYILMNGTGIGFSVERQEVSQLPEVPKLTKQKIILYLLIVKEGGPKGITSYYWSYIKDPYLSMISAGSDPRVQS